MKRSAIVAMTIPGHTLNTSLKWLVYIVILSLDLGGFTMELAKRAGDERRAFQIFKYSSSRTWT